MKRFLLSAAGLILAGAAWAQPPARAGLPPGPSLGSGTSPYLNLLNRNANPAITYYGIVRPQFDTANSIQRLQEQSTANTQAVTAVGELAAPETGHAVGFMTQSRYFNTLSKGGIGRGQVTATATPAAAGRQTTPSLVAAGVTAAPLTARGGKTP